MSSELQFPHISTVLFDADGRMTREGHRFLFRLWERTGGGSGDVVVNSITTNVTTLHTTSAALSNGAAAAAGTLLNAPAAGNPTKWVPINDNGTTRYIPAW